ncbi:signal peptidase I [Blastococcus sp. TF02A-26]|uniref:signal peptidase I n=1 Tax=Blastococcus sp. TF02A-26 TaxID=2250577 RepID=UPI000DE94AD0|nr:signal peptidase I [Blastococcus sp. TF02A-26]RBY86933.1 signal peptidase I [Blastococcus sp. TF02A-26]
MTAVLPAPRTAQAPSAGGPAGARPVRRRRRPVRALLRFTGRWTVRMLVCTAVLSFLGLAVGPRVADYRTMTMLTGSMAPTIDPGDVVVSTPLDVEDVEVGMVITYHIPIDDHRVVTHRVIEVDRTADGTVAVRTQGDANDAPDPWTAVLSGDTAYQVQAVVPEIGNVITLLRESVLSTLFVQLLPIGLGVWMLLAIWRPGREVDDADTHTATAARTEPPGATR